MTPDAFASRGASKAYLGERHARFFGACPGGKWPITANEINLQNAHRPPRFGHGQTDYDSTTVMPPAFVALLLALLRPSSCVVRRHAALYLAVCGSGDDTARQRSGGERAWRWKGTFRGRSRCDGRCKFWRGTDLLVLFVNGGAPFCWNRGTTSAAGAEAERERKPPLTLALIDGLEARACFVLLVVRNLGGSFKGQQPPIWNGLSLLSYS
jgi:hypothetical protein